MAERRNTSNRSVTTATVHGDHVQTLFWFAPKHGQQYICTALGVHPHLRSTPGHRGFFDDVLLQIAPARRTPAKRFRLVCSAKEGGSGELREAGPGGDVEGSLGVTVFSFGGFVMGAKLLQDRGESGLLVEFAGPLPEEAETLLANGALDVWGGFSRCAKSLHRNLLKDFRVTTHLLNQLMGLVVRRCFVATAISKDRCTLAGRSWCEGHKANMLERYAL